MYDRKDKRSVRPFKLFTGVLAVTISVLFLVAFAAPAVAAGEKISTLSGQVMAVDPYAGTLTVKSIGRNESSMGLFTFATDNMTSIVSCAQNNTLTDIGVGQDVTVTYHEKEGKLFADVVEKKLTLALACLYP
jgi:hypothetical protein